MSEWEDDDEDDGNLGARDEFENWPEESAGPEYWLVRNFLDEESA